jgi:hypothetical protein
MPIPHHGSIGERLRRLHAIELALALSVIVGLLFVSMRIRDMPTNESTPGGIVVGTMDSPPTSTSTSTLPTADSRGP